MDRMKGNDVSLQCLGFGACKGLAKFRFRVFTKDPDSQRQLFLCFAWKVELGFGQPAPKNVWGKLIFSHICIYTQKFLKILVGTI